MSSQVKDGYERFLNEVVKIVYFDESPEVPIAKEGTLISISDDAVIVFVNVSQKEVLIPKNRIVRLERKG